MIQQENTNVRKAVADLTRFPFITNIDIVHFINTQMTERIKRYFNDFKVKDDRRMKLLACCAFLYESFGINNKTLQESKHCFSDDGI